MLRTGHILLRLGLVFGFLWAVAPAWAQNVHLSVTRSTAADQATSAPSRGRTMTQVRARFGTPGHVHPAVGQPPITRWDYPSFVVVFEYNRVIDSVRPGNPPTLYHRDELAQQ